MCRQLDVRVRVCGARFLSRQCTDLNIRDYALHEGCPAARRLPLLRDSLVNGLGEDIVMAECVRHGSSSESWTRSRDYPSIEFIVATDF